MSDKDDTKRTLAGGRDAPAKFVLTKQKVLYIVGHSVVAMIFIFALQFYMLKATFETSLMWAAMFGAMAFTIAFAQARRQG